MGETPGDTRATDGRDEFWQPVKTEGTLTDRIVRAIEDLIDKKQLIAGDRLPSERELARLLGVSRPSLRESLKSLEARGLLEARHGEGVFVRTSAEETLRSGLLEVRSDLAELFAMRELLEVSAAGWAADRASFQDVDRLRKALATEEIARMPPVDFECLGELDAQFHMLIVEIAHNRFLFQTLNVLQEMLAKSMENTLMIPGRLLQASRDHRAIFEGIANRDPQLARRATRLHIVGARKAALERASEPLDN